MANYDLLCFLEYYEDRNNVVDSVTNLRIPNGQWQNFYQTNQILSIDPDIGGEYSYLAFSPEGFGSCTASSISDLTLDIAATANIVDITETAMGQDNIVLASLYLQDAGKDNFDGASAQLISRYVGVLIDASISDIAVRWTVNPGINRVYPQVPTRKVTADMVIPRTLQ